MQPAGQDGDHGFHLALVPLPARAAIQAAASPVARGRHLHATADLAGYLYIGCDRSVPAGMAYGPTSSRSFRCARVDREVKIRRNPRGPLGVLPRIDR